MPTSRNVFGLNSRESGVNRYLRFNPFPLKKRKYAYFNSEMCRVGAMVKWIIRTHTLHISDFLWNWLNRRWLFTPDLRSFKPNTARDEGQIVRHNNDGPPISDWQWRHCMLFFFVRSQNRVNLVLYFKPCLSPYTRHRHHDF